MSRHDGVLSARRDYPAATLLQAAASTGYQLICVDAPRWAPRLTEVLRLDGALSGFRAAVGRTGLIRHRQLDLAQPSECQRRQAD